MQKASTLRVGAQQIRDSFESALSMGTQRCRSFWGVAFAVSASDIESGVLGFLDEPSGSEQMRATTVKKHLQHGVISVFLS